MYSNKSIKISIIVTAIILFLAAMYSASGLYVKQDILSILPENDLQISRYKKLLEHFNPMNAMFIDVSFQDTTIDNNTKLEVLTDSLLAAFENSGLFSRVTHKWAFQDLSKTLELLRVHRAELFTKEDSIKISHLIQPDSIRQKLEDWKRQLSQSPAPFLVQQMLQDPLEFDQVLTDKLSNLQQLNTHVTVYNGRLYSSDKRHILIIAYPKTPATDSESAHRLVGFMKEQEEQLNQLAGNATVAVAYLAGHRFSVENETRIKRDIKITVTISVIAIALLALLVYSRSYLMLLTLLPAVFGSTLSLGVVRLILPEISAVVLGSGAMLIGLAVDYGIHVLFHVDQNANGEIKPQIISEAIQKLKKPLILSASSTILAFVTLRLSILPGYQQLSLFVSLGILFALLFVFFVLPILIPKKSSQKKILPTIRLVQLFKNKSLNVSSKRKIFFVLAVISVIILPGLRQVQFEGDVQKLNAVSDEIAFDWQQIENSFGTAMHSTYLVFTGKNIDSLQIKNDKLNQFLKKAKKEKLIQNYSSVAEVFPSKTQCDKNIARWHKLFNANQIQQLKKELEAASVEIGFKANTFSLNLDSRSESNQKLQLSDFSGTVLEELIRTQVSQNEDESGILTQVKIASANDFKQLKSKLQAVFPNILIYNGRDFTEHTVQLIFSEMKRIGVIVLVLIVLLLIVVERNIKSAILMLLPLFLSGLWTFGIMGWLGIKINIINSIISVFVFGLVIDYCFFLKFAVSNSLADTRELSISKSAVTLSALTTIFGLGALLFARHPAMHSLGLTALIGILSGLFAVLIIIPTFFGSHSKKK